MAVYNGNSDPNEYYGGGDADTIRGFQANDWLEGGAGADSVDGGSESDRIEGEDGADILWGNSQANGDLALYSGVGSAEADGSDTINGGAGRDTIYGNQADDFLDGGDSDDLMFGGRQDDWLEGGSGNDAMYGDSAVEDPGLLESGDTASDTLYGAAGRDSLYGGFGNDVLIVDNAEGAEVYDGGSGADTLVSGFYASFVDLGLDVGAGIEVLDMDGYALEGTVGANFFDITGVQEFVEQSLILLYGGNDTFLGSVVGEDVNGGDGDDSLVANDGNDTVYGGVGSDSLFGGLGNDLLIVDDAEGAEVYDGGSGRDTLIAGFYSSFETLSLGVAASVEILDMDGYELNGTDTANTFDLSGIEKFVEPAWILLDSGDDTFIGSVVGEVVLGGDDNDILEGNAGNDNLNGQAGVDALFGGLGADILYVDDAAEGVEVYDGGAGRDTLVSALYASFEELNLGVAAGVEVLDMDGYDLDGTDSTNIIDLTGVEKFVQAAAIRLYVGNDTFLGSRRKETVYGGDGRDTLTGNDGNDRLYGDAGVDLAYGGVGSDNLYGGIDNDSLFGGDGKDAMFGDEGNDSLSGGLASDKLFGGSENDTLSGDAGNDQMAGGGGSDRFVFIAGGGEDKVTDFEDDIDTLVLDDALWTGGLSVAEVIAQFADISQGDVLFTFDDGTKIRLAGFGDAEALLNDILIV